MCCSVREDAIGFSNSAWGWAVLSLALNIMPVAKHNLWCTTESVAEYSSVMPRFSRMMP